MSTRFAVLIGISDYSHVGGAGNLRYASADAKRLAHILATIARLQRTRYTCLATTLAKTKARSTAESRPAPTSSKSAITYLKTRHPGISSSSTSQVTAWRLNHDRTSRGSALKWMSLATSLWTLNHSMHCSRRPKRSLISRCLTPVDRGTPMDNWQTTK